MVALVAGLAVDFVGTIVFVVTLMLLLTIIGYRTEEIMSGLSTMTGLLTMYWVGLAFTLLGAYITASLSKPNCLLNTLLFGLVSTLPSLFFVSWYPSWYTVLCVLTILPASLAAGYAVAARTI